MKKQKEEFSLQNLVFFVFFILIFIYLIVAIGRAQRKNSLFISQDNQNRQIKIFSSKNLGFRINVPMKFQVEESPTAISLKSSKGIIVINRVASSFTKNLNEYFDRLSNLNKLMITKKNISNVNGLDIIYADLHSKVTRKYLKSSYFIFVDHWVYTIETTSPELFDELDQVAKSFKYTP